MQKNKHKQMQSWLLVALNLMRLGYKHTQPCSRSCLTIDGNATSMLC